MRNTIKTLLIVALIHVPIIGFAQQQNMSSQMQADRARQMVDQAIEQAKSMKAKQAKEGPKNGLSVENLQKQKGIDPATLAEKFRMVGDSPVRSSHTLMIFISTSMPSKALLQLGNQAQATGAVLLLRGLRGPLGKKGVLEETTRVLDPIAATGAQIQIDPEAFERYEVSAVPTFVIAPREEGCAEERCNSKANSVVGDVSLEYALEQWSNRGGEIGRLADAFLQRINRN